MRVVLVVSRYHLQLVNQIIDQRNLEIRAVVTDDRTFAIERGCPRNLTFGFWEFKTVIQKIDPDYILFLVPFRDPIDFFTRQMREIKFPLDRICDLSCFPAEQTFSLSANLRKLEENPDHYKIFATGISYSRTGIDPESFDLPLLSFAFSSQDLYYDYKIAEKVVKIAAPPPRKNSEGLRYALIGLAPYSLHYDLSRCTREAFFISKYFLALKDLHNYWIDYETVTSFMLPEFLRRMEDHAKQAQFNYKLTTETMNLQAALEASNEIETWSRKKYPETVRENKQILENYLTLLETHKIFPIIFLPPMMKEYQDGFCREKLEELFDFLYDLLKLHRIALIDGWKIPGFVDHDFRDINHLNIRGAKKFSAKLNSLVQKLEAN